MGRLYHLGDAWGGVHSTRSKPRALMHWCVVVVVVVGGSYGLQQGPKLTSKQGEWGQKLELLGS